MSCEVQVAREKDKKINRQSAEINGAIKEF